jgi:predicted ATPase
MPSVSSLTIKGYKSIRSLENFPLGQLNVLIGANGAGKSNFINVFRLLQEIVDQHLYLYVPLQGGPDALLHFGRAVTERLHVAFQFGMDGHPRIRQGYRFDLLPTLDNRLIFESEESLFFGDELPVVNPSRLLGQGHSESKLKEASDSYSKLVYPCVSNWRVYHFQDTSDTAPAKRLHATNDNLRLKSDAANLAAYVRMLRRDHPSAYTRIVETIRLVMPFFDDFVQRQGEPDSIELEWLQKGMPDTPFRASTLSDGSLRFICLVTLLLQPIELLPDTLLIDEPELGLHPYAIAVLADVFKQVAEDKQVIVSTQSVELINALAPEDVIVVEQDDGASTFKRFTQAELADWLQEYSMGELWLRNILGGRP